MHSSLCFSPDCFNYFDSFGSNVCPVIKCFCEFSAEQMIIISTVDKDNYIVEAVNPLQHARRSNDVISIGKNIIHLLPSPLGEEFFINCKHCVMERVPVNYQVPGGHIEAHNHPLCLKVLLLPIMNQQGVVTHLLCIFLSSGEDAYTQIASFTEQELESRVLERTAELVAANSQLTYLATHDALTETYNRRHLLDLANAEFKRISRYGLSLCVMMLDIDHFKSINDEHGHTAGDHMLKTVAQVMRSSVRDWDLVGRYGGDEFIIILPEADIHGAKVIAERLGQTLKNERLSVSIGIATLELNDHSIADLIDRADHLLMNAKRNGRNRIECTSPALTPLG
ncbi:GGDEF domain-containing protein [Halomonas sp. ISL-60]|uniref:GGDEF domain-containing protein n=1 Tax=Halomonas sp. ISL-56 TaxID=2819149 RepID=UPI001BEC3983|nr:GGDEF domain-containing protein [Halomonas sp. ISL-56]MBT2774340.1 GGDEF domain-containing protein [Halomonas sp. ISL-60]MBT2799909.1 GGDEF domain-containing protein [Halomonas sp. ISL-56]